MFWNWWHGWRDRPFSEASMMLYISTRIRCVIMPGGIQIWRSCLSMHAIDAVLEVVLELFEADAVHTVNGLIGLCF
ncbi:MAG: hypothetical protein F6J87_18585 [Spirulina sp. SIO3F2]|nr:hypothetical protein [Spirulina sp. SIO3F2]